MTPERFASICAARVPEGDEVLHYAEGQGYRLILVNGVARVSALTAADQAGILLDRLLQRAPHRKTVAAAMIARANLLAAAGWGER